MSVQNHIKGSHVYNSLIFGAAVVGSGMLECVTRDGREFEFPGPPNMPAGGQYGNATDQHRACLRFALDGSTWTVTFRRYDNSDRYGEISAEKRLP